MTPRPGVAPLALALLAGVGCATSAPRVPVTPAASLTAEPAPRPATAETPPGPPAARAPEPAPPALQPVTENQAFATIEGVPRYKIGPDDVLEILLATGAAQEKQTSVVKGNGTVTVAFLEVKVGGLTTEQAAEAIRRALSQFFRQASVEILVKEFHSKRVSVLGAVAGKAGTFPLKGRTTLLDLLAEVGGPAPSADLERVRVVRRDGSVTLNLYRLLEEPMAQAFVLDAGDVVFVPSQGIVLAAAAAPGEVAAVTQERRVFVLGEVKSPGVFPLAPNMRLSHVLAMAGGPTEVAILESARIIRGGPGNPQVVEADFRALIENGDKRQDLVLQAADLIVLPRSAIGNWNAFIAKIRPTFELLTFPLSLPVQIKVLGN